MKRLSAVLAVCTVCLGGVHAARGAGADRVEGDRVDNALAVERVDGRLAGNRVSADKPSADDRATAQTPARVGGAKRGAARSSARRMRRMLHRSKKTKRVIAIQP